MKRRFVLAAALSMLVTLTAAAPRKAAPRPLPPPAAIPLADTVRVAMTTEFGTIVIDLDGKRAPVTTANFLRYVDLKRLDGITFYRSMHLAWGDQPNGLVQGGLRGDYKKVMKPIAHEPTNVTGVLHKVGSISMARFAPGTATADFSILLADMPGLDANPEATDPEAQAGYAAFGRVAEGMDVVRRIWDAPISQTLGEGALKGQMIETPVKVLSVRRVPLPPPSVAAVAPMP